MKDFAYTISPFRKRKKKRTRSSSSSSSSSSMNEKEDSPHDKSDSKDKSFNSVQLGERESPGPEKGRPRGGFVRINNVVELGVFFEMPVFCRSIVWSSSCYTAHLSQISVILIFQSFVFFLNFSKYEFVEGAGTEATLRQTVQTVTQ